MRDTNVDCSFDRPQLRVVSPTNSYRDINTALLEPISPKHVIRSSVRMDESTYNMLTGKTTFSPALLLPSVGETQTGTNPTRIGSCPYCLLGTFEHNCSATSTGRFRFATSLQLSSHECRPITAPMLSMDKEGEEKREEDRYFLSPVSVGGVTFYLQEVLAEGWLHKKGTGHDWLGSRGWKVRWARLCMGSTTSRIGLGGVLESNVPNAECPTSAQALQSLQPIVAPQVPTTGPIVPLLLLYWYPSSSTVSTAIVLDSTVVMSIDMDEKTQRVNPYRFEVQHATTQEKNITLPTHRRTFAAPQRERDAWVYAIAQALLTYAKAKERARKLQEMQMQLQQQLNTIASSRTLPHGMNWEGEYPWNRLCSLLDGDTVTTISRSSKCATPPLSPTASTRRCLVVPHRSSPTRSNSSPSLLSRSNINRYDETLSWHAIGTND